MSLQPTADFITFTIQIHALNEYIQCTYVVLIFKQTSLVSIHYDKNTSIDSLNEICVPYEVYMYNHVILLPIRL